MTRTHFISAACRACGAPVGGPAAAVCPRCLEQAKGCPQPVEGFLVLRELGRGGMGVVYLAIADAGGELVALKTLAPNVGTPVQVARFLREAAILWELKHPNIVAYRAMGRSGGQAFVAMEYVPGTDAARLLRANGGPMPVGRAVGLVRQLLAGLAFAHGRRFVHRDVKPHNLLVTAGPDGGEVAKLADFGLARVYGASALSGLTQHGELGGTVAFMAPEQVTDFRSVGPPADQYSAAATLYNLLSARYVYDLSSKIQEQVVQIVLDDPVPLAARRPDLPPDLAAVIHRALAREPADRYPDVAALAQALAPWADTPAPG